MKINIFILLSCVIAAFCVSCQTPLNFNKKFSYVSFDPSKGPFLDSDGNVEERFRFVADFNGDGLEDVALSASPNTFIMRGSPFTLYLKTTNGRYSEVANFTTQHMLCRIRITHPTKDENAKFWTSVFKYDDHADVVQYEILKNSTVSEVSSTTFAWGDKSGEKAYYSAYEKRTRVPIRFEHSNSTNENGEAVWVLREKIDPSPFRKPENVDTSNDLRADFRWYFRENHMEDFLIEWGQTAINVFYFDVDGDGVEEAFAISYADYDRSGYFWKVFRHENGEWHRLDTFYDNTDFTSSSALNFYYLDDKNEQPRLYVDKTATYPPEAVFITKDNKIITVDSSRNYYEKLREEGKLKPIESAWYDVKDKKILSWCPLTQKETYAQRGDNKLVTPRECYGDTTLIEEDDAVYCTFLKYYQHIIDRGSNTNAICCFKFDFDGDWLDELFYTCDAMATEQGSKWHVFEGQHHAWREIQSYISPEELTAPASRFYYRDDTREEPRLYIDTCVTNSPMAVRYDRKYSIIDTIPIERQDFEKLREKGLLKPIESTWIDIREDIPYQSSLIRTIKGNNKPINPDDEFPYDDLSPFGNIRLKNSDSTNALGQAVWVLEDEYIPTKRENANPSSEEEIE